MPLHEKKGPPKSGTLRLDLILIRFFCVFRFVLLYIIIFFCRAHRGCYCNEFCENSDARQNCVGVALDKNKINNTAYEKLAEIPLVSVHNTCCTNCLMYVLTISSIITSAAK